MTPKQRRGVIPAVNKAGTVEALTLNSPMPTRHIQRTCCLPLVALALSTIALAGCNRGPRMVQVSGKVLYKDGSAPKGGVRVIRFEPSKDAPEETRRVASGQIETDGSFHLFTRKPGDGVFPGEYAVTFTLWKGPRDPVSYVDEKFTASSTTPYHVTIEDDTTDLKFEIEPAPAGQTANPSN